MDWREKSFRVDQPQMAGSHTTNAQHTSEDHQIYHEHNEEMVHHTRG